MKIGILSDTHDDIEITKKAVDFLRQKKVDLVLHLGDYVSPPIVKLFKGLKLIGIFGNNDGYKEGLIKAFEEIGGEIKGNFASFQLARQKIALYHGEFLEISQALAQSQNFDILLTGHRHKSSKKEIGKTLWIEIGALNRFLTKDPQPKIAILELPSKKFKFTEIK